MAFSPPGPICDAPAMNMSRTLNGSYLMACGIESADDELGNHPEHHQKSSCDGHRPLVCDTSTSSPSSDSVFTDDENMAVMKTSRWVGQQQARHSQYKPKVSRMVPVDAVDRSLPAPADTSDGVVVCRICHDDDSEEALLSPCFCSGSMGMLHMTCLERWLGASDTTKCEICQFQFSITKKPRPCKWYLTNKKLGRERRYLLADMCCCIWYTPSTIATTLSCLIGATHFTSEKKSWEATSLILLATINMCFFILWIGFAFRRNLKICNKWKEDHQIIRITYNPPAKKQRKLSSPAPVPPVPPVSPVSAKSLEFLPPITPFASSLEKAQRERITGTPYGSPWPRRKLNCTSTPYVTSAPYVTCAYANPSACGIPEPKSMDFFKDRVMRKWGLHEQHSSTPVHPHDATMMRQEQTRQDPECSGVLCMTPILKPNTLSTYGMPSSDAHMPISVFWRRGQMPMSQLAKAEQDHDGINPV